MTAFIFYRLSNLSELTLRPIQLWRSYLWLIQRFAWSLVLVLFSVQSHTLELPEGFQIHGFASQGYILTSDNNFFGDSDDQGSLDFTELGINASWLMARRFQLSGQLLSRRAGEGHEGDIQLDYGLADYNFLSAADRRLGVRIGRFKNPLGLYNDTRDVAFTRPGILLPQSLYFDRTRTLALSADGVEFYAEHRNGIGDFFLELGAGLPQVDDLDTELSLLGRDFPGDLDNDVSYIGRLLYERDGGRLRFGLSGALVNIGYQPNLVDPLERGSIRFQPWILSAQYNAERWSLTGEYALRRFKFQDFGAIPDMEFDGESYYAQFTYRINSNWEAMLRYDLLYSDRDDRDGREFEARTGRPAHTRFAKDWTVGLRWDVTPTLMLRTEVHRVDGSGWLPPQDNPDTLSIKRRWELFGILASYRF